MIEILSTSLPALLLLVVKHLTIIQLAGALARFVPGMLAAWVMAWTLLLAGQITLLLCLSPFGAIGPASIWLAFAIAALSVARLGNPTLVIGDFLRRAGLAAYILAAVVCMLALRDLVIGDMTWDALTYGVARIGVWLNYGSILTNMPTQQINIFANEWNGELNGLIFAAAAGNIYASIFGNVDVLIFVIAASIWLARCAGADLRNATAVAALVCITPAVLGLSATVKGDLLACGGIVAAAGWAMTSAKPAFRNVGAAMLIASLGLAVGAKISTAVGAALFGLAALYWMPKVRPLQLMLSGMSGGALATLLCSRLIVNWWQYGNPVERVIGERAEPGIQTFLANAWTTIVRFFWLPDALSAQCPGCGTTFWVLSAGMGLTGAMLVYASWQMAQKRGRTQIGLPETIAVAAIICVLVMATVLPARVWSFRYLLPFVMVPLLILFARVELGSRQRLIAGVCAINFVALLVPGEWLPRLKRTVFDATPLQRAIYGQAQLREAAGVDKLALDREQGATVAILNDPDTAIVPFVGSRAQNKLYFAESLDGLAQTVAAQKPDVVVITKYGQPPEGRMSSIRDYSTVISNRFYDIAVPTDAAANLR